MAPSVFMWYLGQASTSMDIVVGATKLIETKKWSYGPQDIANERALSCQQIKSRRFGKVELLESSCFHDKHFKCTVYLRKVTGSVTYTVKTGTLY